MKNFRGESRPMLREWLHQAKPAIAVWSENRSRSAEIAFERYGGAVVERMGERSWRVNPLEAVSLQRE